MKLKENLFMAVENLRINPVRSLLTTLGIIIGVGAVIIMLSLGEGAKHEVTNRIQAMGSNLLIVTGGREKRGGSFGGNATLTNGLLMPIFESSASITDLAPEFRGNRLVKAGTESIQTTVIGTTPSFFRIRNYELASGRFLTIDDINQYQKVAILGAYIARELFPGQESPLGCSLQIDQGRFEVVGVLEEKGQNGVGNNDDLLIIPLTTMQRRLARTQKLTSIYIQARNESEIDMVYERVNETLLRELKDENAFTIRNQAEILSTAQETLRTFTLLLAGIAAVSLLVGGIGVMNIMLVAVTERIKEIGIRKALGAKRNEVLILFLFEAVLLSVVGGVCGVFLGWIGATIAGSLLNWSAIITWPSILVSLAFSMMVGLFFGVYPAYKAAGLDPVTALHYD